MQALIETWITRNVPHRTGGFMINDSEESRKAAAQFKVDMEYENVARYCPHCDEEYQLPEDMESCVICEKPLQIEE